jgi:hypothetical protein
MQRCTCAIIQLTHPQPYQKAIALTSFLVDLPIIPIENSVRGVHPIVPHDRKDGAR